MIKHYFLFYILVFTNLEAATLKVEEFRVYFNSLQTQKSLSKVMIGKSTDDTFLAKNIEVELSHTNSSNALGEYTLVIKNLSKTNYDDVKVYGFFDLSIDEASNSFFNEYGMFISLINNQTSYFKPTLWQIDEPDYLDGTIVHNLEKGQLDQVNHLPAQLKDDMSFALGFEIGQLPINGEFTAIFNLSEINIGGLAHIDPDSNSTFYLNARANEVYVKQPSAPITMDDNITSETRLRVNISVLENDTDEDGDIVPSSLHFTSSSAVDSDADGDSDRLEVVGEGIWTVTNTGIVSFLPENNFTADPSPISYNIKDATSLSSNNSLIFIDYLQNNPIAVDDNAIAPTNTTVSINILENDTDSDNDINPSSVSLVTAGATDSDADGDMDSLVIMNVGTWIADNNGYLVFSPAIGFTADPPSVSYKVSDNTGLDSGIATVFIDYIQKSPVTVSDFASVASGESISLNILENDTDEDKDILVSSINLVHSSAIDSDSDGDKDTLIIPNEGNWSVNNIDGTVQFTPALNFTADPSVIYYTLKDKTDLVSNISSITLDYPQTAPITQDDVRTSDTGLAININVLVNDTDAQNDINVSTVNITSPLAQDSDGDGDKDRLVILDEGEWKVNNHTGDIKFTPITGMTADPSMIMYTVKDNTGLISQEANVSIDYVQYAPVVVNDIAEIIAGETISLNLIANDTDKNSDMNISTINITNFNAQDTDADGDYDFLNVPGEGNWSVSNDGQLIFVASSSLSQDPQPLHYNLKDTTGLLSNTAQVNLTYVANENTCGCGENNLVRNGSFEKNRYHKHLFCGVYRNIPNWRAYPGVKISDDNVMYGKNKIEIDVNRNGMIWQYMHTHFLKKYTLSFAFHPRTDSRPAFRFPCFGYGNRPRAIDVYWNHSKIGRIQGGAQEWQTHTFEVTGSVLASKLKFKAVGTDRSYAGYIDNIQLCEKKD